MSILEVSSIDNVFALKAKIPPRPSVCPLHARVQFFKDTTSKDGIVCAITQVRPSLFRYISIGFCRVTMHIDFLEELDKNSGFISVRPQK